MTDTDNTDNTDADNTEGVPASYGFEDDPDADPFENPGADHPPHVAIARDTDIDIDPFDDGTTVAATPPVDMPEWTMDAAQTFVPDTREHDLTPEQRRLLAERRAEFMRLLHEPDMYTRDYDAEVHEIRTDERMFGIDFSEFLFRYYPRNNIKADFNNTTAVHISDKGITLTVGAFQRDVIKKQSEQAADDALMVMSGNQAIRQNIRDNDLLDLDDTAEKIKDGELDVHDLGNAVIRHGTYQVARRHHNVGVIAVYKGGKSALMDHLSACSLSGMKLFGELDVEQVPDFDYKYTDDSGATHHATVPGKVLYVDPERGLSDAKMELGRAFAWLKNSDDEPLSGEEATAVRQRLVFYDAAEHPLNLAAPDDQKHLIEFCNENHVTRVILDSAMMLSGKTDNLVDTEVDALFRAWEKIKSKTQIGETYWVVHTSHGDQNRAFGSQRWMARLQSIWLLQREQDGSKFEFSVALGRGGTKYPKREWGLHADTKTPYFITALSTAEHEESLGSSSTEETGKQTGRGGETDELIAVQCDVVENILTSALVSEGESPTDTGEVMYGPIANSELFDLVMSRWADTANRFVGPPPSKAALTRRIEKVLEHTTAAGHAKFARVKSGRTRQIFLTIDGYDEANADT